MNQPLCSSYSSCYLYLPRAFIFICIHQSIHHHRSPVRSSVFSFLSLWRSLCIAWGLWRYQSSNIRVYEACDGMHHHCIYSTVCVCMLPWHTKTYWVHLHDSAGTCFPVVVVVVVVNEGWTYDWATLLCWCMFVFPVPLTVCENMWLFVCWRVRETVWILLFGLIDVTGLHYLYLRICLAQS